MAFLTLTRDNLDAEHICCAMADKKSAPGVAAKKAWLAERIGEGLRFTKLDQRGKVFVEYLPAEKAWAPLAGAEGYAFIDCLWVAGSFQGQGHGRALMEACEADVRARGMKGMLIVSSPKKRPYMADRKFLLRQGFAVCDTAEPYFELMVKPFGPTVDSAGPRFADSARTLSLGDDIRGVDIFYTAQCPFTIPYIALLEPVIAAAAVPVRTHRITTAAQAQGHLCPAITYGVFVNGRFRTHEILTPAKLEKLLSEFND